MTTFFERGYTNARVRVTTDLEIAFEAAFGSAEGIVLLAGTGSAAFGRDASGRTVRAGGRGPWISDEGSAFDIGRRAVQAVVLAEEHRGPVTGLSGRIFSFHQCRNWDQLGEQIAKNPDAVFPKTFSLVATLAEEGDADVTRVIRPMERAAGVTIGSSGADNESRNAGEAKTAEMQSPPLSRAAQRG